MRAPLPALVLALATAAPLPAQAPGSRVLPVLYLPADLPFDTARLRLQVAAVRDVRAWYAERLGGLSFYADPLVVQRSRHTFAELAGADFQNWWPLPEREFAGWGLPWNDSSRIKILLLAQGAGAWAGADSENGGIASEAEAGRVDRGWLGGLAVVGDSSLGGMLAGVCPRAGAASHRKPEGGTEWWCNWNTYRGTIAHELGHTFGVPHPDAFRAGFRCDSTVIANMQCHWAWPADSLLPFEAAHLRSLPVFGADALAEWEPAVPAAARNARFPVFERDGVVLWLAGRGGGTGYLWGVELAGDTSGIADVTWSRPAGAARFVADLGLPPGAGRPARYRIEAGPGVVEGTIGPGDPPRTVVLVTGNTSEVRLRIDGGPGVRLAIGHPRWSPRKPVPAPAS
jgi:hypothetical protein